MGPEATYLQGGGGEDNGPQEGKSVGTGPRVCVFEGGGRTKDLKRGRVWDRAEGVCVRGWESLGGRSLSIRKGE